MTHRFYQTHGIRGLTALARYIIDTNMGFERTRFLTVYSNQFQ